MVEAELCRRSFSAFVRRAWHFVEQDHDFIENWHIDVLCSVLQQATQSGDVRIIVNIPPGTMKTLLVSVLWPAWMWATNPGLRFFAASYQASRSIEAADKVRKIVTSDWYQTHFALRLSENQNAKTRFDTDKGGWFLASSVGGLGTGVHPDYILIDDPLSEPQSRSDVERTAPNVWYDRTIAPRGVARGVNTIVVMQRLHQGDLSGHLLSRGGWDHVCFPMRYAPTRPATDKDAGHTADPRDPRRAPGELLWPAVFTEAKTRALELSLGPYGTAGQLQQQPAPEGGGLFKREWFKFVDVAPVVARRARGWDTAASEGAGDYTAGVKIAESEDLFYVEDVIAEQVGPAGQNALMRQTAEADGIACAQREEKEGGSSGVVVVDARLKLLKGYDYKHVPISGDKVTRSKPFRAQVEGGNVYLVRGAWNEAYIRQLCDFPTGNHDDMVDASSCAFNAVLLEPVPQARRRRIY